MANSSSNFVIGNKTKIYFSVMPSQLLDNPVAPSNVNITTTALAAINATTIAVSALSGPVPAGTPIKLTSGQTSVWVYTTESKAAGAISLAVEALTAAVASGSTGTYTALLELVGGTTSEESIQSTDQEVTVYGDDLGYSTGIVTRANWQISYTFNVLPSDAGYFRLAYVAQNAVQGVRGWIRKADAPPAGYSTGETIEGLVDVTDFRKTNPADGKKMIAA